MTMKPRIAIVIGSTRPGRYADKAAGWMLKQTQARDDIEAELLDLRDHPLPFFDEKGPPMSTPSENAEALRWQKSPGAGTARIAERKGNILAWLAVSSQRVTTAWKVTFSRSAVDGDGWTEAREWMIERPIPTAR